jgi:hypothetical protein
VRWSVTTCIPEISAGQLFGGRPVLQFNSENTISYDENGYSTIGVRGTLEIPLTRNAQNDRTVPRTVDDYRQQFLTSIADTFDLTRFRVQQRHFAISRDARTLEWDFNLIELSPMGPPAMFIDGVACAAMTAGGSFTVRPEKSVANLQGIKWICTLRCNYTVPPGMPRRTAWLAFVSLWHFRMQQSELGYLPANATVAGTGGGGIAANSGALEAGVAIGTFVRDLFPSQSGILATGGVVAGAFGGVTASGAPPGGIYGGGVAAGVAAGLASVPVRQKAFPIDLKIDEGVYDDSKTIKFEASWRLLTTVDRLLFATGVWRESGIEGGDVWASAAYGISGWTGTLENRVAPQAIVDFGS